MKTWKQNNFLLALAVAAGVLNQPLFQTARADAFTFTGSMLEPRFGHIATLLPNGKVLVAGGWDTTVGNGPINESELYDSVTGTWTVTGAMNTPRFGAASILMPNGNVLIAGGWGFLSSAELYDPIAGVWTTTGSMHTGRNYHTATLLPNGKVLVAGGNSGTNGLLTSSAELYHPAAGTWTVTGSLTTAR